MNHTELGPFLSDNNFTVMNLHIQSILSKFDQLQILIIELQSKPDAIIIQETWRSDVSDSSLFKLNGYNMIERGNTASSHGGLIIYLKQTHTYQILDVKYDSFFICVLID